MALSKLVALEDKTTLTTSGTPEPLLGPLYRFGFKAVTKSVSDQSAYIHSILDRLKSDTDSESDKLEIISTVSWHLASPESRLYKFFLENPDFFSLFQATCTGSIPPSVQRSKLLHICEQALVSNITDDDIPIALPFRVERTPSDSAFISSDFFSAEEKTLLDQMETFRLRVLLNRKPYEIHTNFIRNPDAIKTALFLHGFGLKSTWGQWCKTAKTVFDLGYHLLFVDFPGFGQSSGASHQTLQYKTMGASLIFSILDAFGAKRNVTVVAQCGGAGFFLRALTQSEHFTHMSEARFGHRHVLSNAYIAEWPRNFNDVVDRLNMKFIVCWRTDANHLEASVPYKNWSRLAKKGDSRIVFHNVLKEDGGRDKYFPLAEFSILGMSRSPDRKIKIHTLSAQFLADMRTHLSGLE